MRERGGRDTPALDAERLDTPLGPALVTTPEQTVLDLARCPALGGAENEISAAVAGLYRRSDRERLTTLAAEQGLTEVLARWACVTCCSAMTSPGWLSTSSGKGWCPRRISCGGER